MGFFDDFKQLIEKYNLEIHPIQLDENIRILNDKYHMNLQRDDLPPPVLLLRTSEGDFTNVNLGPIFRDPNTGAMKFYNIKDTTQVISLFPEQVAAPLTSPVQENSGTDFTFEDTSTLPDQTPVTEEAPKKTRKSKKKATEETTTEEKPKKTRKSKKTEEK